MKKIISAILFALAFAVASPSFADGAAAQSQSFISEVINAKPSATDLADMSFAQLFGKFVFKPFGGYPGGAEDATTLAHVLGYSNIVAMILGVIILSYTIMGGALKTAADGELLGRGWSSVWLPLRTATAFGMITPVSDGSGVFSVAQSLVIWAVIIGSNSGTWVWEKGASLLTMGSPAIPTSMVYDSSSYRNIVSVLHCSVVRDKYFKEREITDRPVGTASYSVIEVGKKSSTFSYKDGYSLKFENVSQLSSISFEGCGSIKFPVGLSTDIVLGVTIPTDPLNGTQSTSMAFHNAFKKQAWEEKIGKSFASKIPEAYLQFLNSALAQAKILADGPSAAEIAAARTNYSANKKDAAIYDQIVNSGKALDAVGASYASYISNSKASLLTPDIASDWKKTMTEGGWMGAGVWFFEASKLQATVYNYLNKLTTGATYTPNPESWVSGCGFMSWGSCDDSMKDQQAQLLRIDELKTYTTPNNAIQSSNGIVPLSASNAGLDSSIFDSLSVAVAQTFMNGLMTFGASQSVGEGVGSTAGMAQSTSGMISPFTALSSMGRGLQNINEVTWWIGLGATAFAKGVEGSALSFFGAGAAPGAIQYVVMTLVPLMSILLGMSFVMAMAIPFTPVVTWILMSCGYLLTVIEAIAAAPLAVIMMATPEGDGLSGQNLQKALQLVNAIVLRPTLSIVGLFAAMTLSYVGFSLMNTMFWKVAGLATNLGLYEIVGLITIYISVSLNLCKYMIAIMHKIPDQILGWMGGGVTPFGENAEHVTDSLRNPGNIGGGAIKTFVDHRNQRYNLAAKKRADEWRNKMMERLDNKT